MGWLVLIIVLALLVLWLGGRSSSKEAPTWRQVETNADESTVRYRDRSGAVRQETDGCNGCIQIRAEQLQREGCVIEEVQIGRRNSGDL